MKHNQGGANVKNTDNLGRTPLHYAIKESRMLLVATGADIHPRDSVKLQYVLLFSQKTIFLTI